MNSIFDRFRTKVLYQSDDVTVTTAVVGTYISAKDFPISAFFFQITTVGGAPSLLRVLQATSSAGGSAKAITGATIPAAAGAITSFDTALDICCIEVDAEALDVANSFVWLAPEFTFSDVTGTNPIVCWVVQGQSRFAYRALNSRLAADAAVGMVKASG